ncbi:MAG: hypothetical protein NTW80_09030, partial [Deltaproteobacteria bacterium]|nr:hypothetical protein [Deltaproteobacteria bacterium]
GCFTSRKPIRLRDMLLPLFILVLLLAIPITRTGLSSTSDLLSVLGDLVIWNNNYTSGPVQTILSVSLGLVLTFFLMALLLDIFVPIGRFLGRLMDEHPRTIWAYSVNVAGSLIGTWLFVLVSICYQPPLTWFLILGALTLFFLGRSGRGWQLNYALLAGIVILSFFAGLQPGSLEVIWSPYQKLVLGRPDPQKRDIGDYIVTVNNTGYQGMVNLSETHLQSDPQHFPPEMRGLSQYDLPLLLHPKPQTFLVVGAGTGNDAAGGLRHGVKQITAVEIDPAIISLERRYHPEKPYASPAVRLVNDDARSFFATCQERYDVIAFGLLDSHTTTAMTNARLDHYVYTKESIARAKSLLADGGIMVLSFEAQKPFIADRMAEVLREVFSEEPIAFRVPGTSYGWGGVLFIAGDLATARKQIAAHPRLAASIQAWQQQYPLSLSHTTRITSDDWPYIYLQTPSIPLLYYLLALLMVLLVLRGHKYLSLSNLAAAWSRSHWHFFFLGAAFMLLEVQNISKASVALGNTWDVNAVIVSGVLAMILLANLLAHRFPGLPLRLVYLGLVGACLALYFVDLSRFAFLPYATKALVIGVLTTLPVLFSGIVFIRSFALAPAKDQALGANLIGALVGALLQSVTFITGIKALLLM